MSLKNEIKRYVPMVEAVVELFHPFVEAAIHDLKSGKIIDIFNNISNRQVGDKSPIEELNIKTNEFPDHFKPYMKRNWDGKQLKCTSISIKNNTGKTIGLICFNVDTSFFQEFNQTLGRFLTVSEKNDNPIEMYGGECEEHINCLTDNYLKENNINLKRLKRNQKKELVQHLYKKGLFNYKNSVPYCAEYLNLCRASIYNYIKEIGG